MKAIGLLVQSLESGGSERSAVLLADLLSEQYSVRLITFSETQNEYSTHHPLHSLRCPPRRSLPARVFNFLRKCARLSAYAKRNKLEVVLSFGQDASHCLAFSPIPCRKILSARGYGYLVRHKKWIHVLLRFCDGMLFNAKEMRSEYLRAFPADASKCFCLNNVIDLKAARESAADPLPEIAVPFWETHRVLVCVGRFSAEKGQWNLIQAFCRLRASMPGIGLAFVGHRGDYEEKIREMAAASPYAKDILFLGYQQNPFPFLARAEVFVLPSITEGFPNAVLEAMAVGTPVVCSAFQTGARELLSDETLIQPPEYGYMLCPYGLLTPRFAPKPDFSWSHSGIEQDGMAEALKRLLEDAQLRKTLSDNASRKVIEFDMAAQKQRYIELIEQTLRPKHTAPTGEGNAEA